MSRERLKELEAMPASVLARRAYLYEYANVRLVKAARKALDGDEADLRNYLSSLDNPWRTILKICEQLEEGVEDGEVDLRSA